MLELITLHYLSLVHRFVVVIVVVLNTFTGVYIY